MFGNGPASDDGGQTWSTSPGLEGVYDLVIADSGWFVATDEGVFRLQLVREPVTLADTWQVLGSNFSRPGAVSVAPDGTLLIGDESRVRRITTDGQQLSEWSSPANARVNELAQAPDGTIYIAGRSRGVQIIGEDGHYGNPIALPQDEDPNGVALDGTGNVYVTQAPQFNPGGNPTLAVTLVSALDKSTLTQWGEPGIGDTQLGGLPWGIAVDSAGNVYVADTAYDRVKEFTPGGTLLTIWRGLRGPAGVAVDASGNVYVADTNANRVVELAPDGSQVASWGTWGTGLGQFWEPEGVAVDPQTGSIYVADTFNNRVVRIDPAPSSAAAR
jgi:sugar lactone lactonase YvrE